MKKLLTSMLTVTFFTVFSMANTLTGSLTDSPGPSTLGRVPCTIRGFLTGAVSSAEPYAPLYPATTITLTEPMYSGMVKVVVWDSPFFSSNGPKNFTMGLKRLALRLPLCSRSWSPPMLSILCSSPLKAPITWS